MFLGWGTSSPCSHPTNNPSGSQHKYNKSDTKPVELVLKVFNFRLGGDSGWQGSRPVNFDNVRTVFLWCGCCVASLGLLAFEACAALGLGQRFFLLRCGRGFRLRCGVWRVDTDLIEMHDEGRGWLCRLGDGVRCWWGCGQG